MKARNLETGVISNVGPSFLVRQPKPYIAPSGKFYKDGVWVPYQEPPISDEAAKLIADAKKPVETKAEVPASPKIETQVETKVEAPAETKTEPTVETKVEAPAETKTEPTVETKSKADQKSEAKAEDKKSA